MVAAACGGVGAGLLLFGLLVTFTDSPDAGPGREALYSALFLLPAALLIGVAVVLRRR